MPPVLQRTIREIHQRLRALETREYAEVVGPGSVINAQYLTLALHAVLTAERRFVAGDGLVGTDGGANADYTLDVDFVAAWSGLEFAAGELRVDLDAAFLWAGAHTFNVNIALGAGVTIDGMDPSAFLVTYAAHDHSAGDPTQIDHADLVNVLANQHHNENHVLLSAPHTDTLAAAVVDGDVIIGNVTPAWSRLAIAIPVANVRNVLGIDNAELRPSWKTALDGVNPVDIGVAAPGVSLIFSHRDHVHAHPPGLGANLHHNEVHVVNSTGPHAEAGLAAGNVLRASGAAAFAFAQLQHGDLGGVAANQHHTQIHDVVGGDHTLTGAQWVLVGATAVNTIGLLTPSDDVSAGVEAILKSTAAGLLSLYALNIGTNTASTFMTGPGITIQQGAYDDEAFAVQSTDVAHGMTAIADTDTYSMMNKAQDIAGGLQLSGLKDADGDPGGALLLSGWLGENVDTTKTTAGRAITEVEGFIKSGTGIGNTNADGNVFGVRTWRGGGRVTLLLVDEDGDTWQDGSEYLVGSHRQSISVGARVYRNIDQVIGNNVFTAVSFTHQRWDDPDDDQWVIGTPTNLTCQFDGIYVISGHIFWDVNVVGVRAMRVYLNGATNIAQTQTHDIGNYVVHSIATVYKLSVGDFLELEAYQNSGGNLNAISDGNYSPEFSMVRVA